MTWLVALLPEYADIPAGGNIRTVSSLPCEDPIAAKERRAALRRAYERAYYHAKLKPRRQRYTPEQQLARKEKRAAAYMRNIERERENARARYWRNRDRYAADSRERMRLRRARVVS